MVRYQIKGKHRLNRDVDQFDKKYGQWWQVMKMYWKRMLEKGGFWIYKKNT